MSSSRRRVDHFQHQENHNTSQNLHTGLLQDIKTNTENININVGDVEINVNDLEVLQTATNSKLDTINTTLTAGNVVDTSALSTHALQTAIHNRQDDILTASNAIKLSTASIDTDLAAHKTQNNTHLGNIFSRQDDILTSNNATKLTNATIATKITSLESANHTDLGNIFSRQDEILTSNNATKLTNATIATKITSLESTNHTDLGNIFSRQDDILTSCNATKLTSATTATKTSALLTANHTDLGNIFSRQDDILTSCNAVKTNTQSVENCVSSNKMNVNISSGIGDLATESTLQTIAEFNCDTTDVNVTSLIPGVGATNLGKAIQSAQGATDTGVATLAVRNDTLADLAGADHDYAPLQVDASGALYIRSMVTDLAITASNNILTTIDEDTNAIKTSVQLLDNAIDGNYLNVNQNIAGTDVASNSGNKSAQTQRVCIATDDINLAAIKTSVQLIDNAMHTGVIPSAALNVSVGTSALPSGAATDTSILSMRVREDQATVNGQYLMGTSAVVRQDTLASLVGTSGDNTQMSVDANGALYNISPTANALLTTIDEDTNAIKIAVENLDNAVDGNYLNVNQNIAGTDVASNSGNKSAQTQRVVIATDDIPIALVNTKLTAIESVLDEIKIDTEAIETAVEILDDLAIAEDTAHSTGQKGIQMLGVRQDSQADFAADGDYVPLSIDGNGDVRVKLDDVSNAVIDVIAAKSTLATTSELKELLSGVTINAGALSSEFDTENYERIRVFGNTTALIGLADIVVMGSNASGGTFYNLGEVLTGTTTASTHYVFGKFENLPRYIKILNNHGSTNFTFTKLYLQGSGGRLAV